MAVVSNHIGHFNATFLKQEGVTVKGQKVISYNRGKVKLADGTVLPQRGVFCTYDDKKVVFNNTGSAGDTAGDDL